MEITVCKNGEMVRDVIECNSSGGAVIIYTFLYLCIYDQVGRVDG